MSKCAGFMSRTSSKLICVVQFPDQGAVPKEVVVRHPCKINLDATNSFGERYRRTLHHQAPKHSRAMWKGREHSPQSSSTTLQPATVDFQAPSSGFDQNTRTTHGVHRTITTALHVEPTSGAA
jgi:hypothetical protein